MRFNQQHGFYCGVDPHAKSMHACDVNQAGETLADQNIETRPDRFLQLIRPYREQLVVAETPVCSTHDRCLVRRAGLRIGVIDAAMVNHFHAKLPRTSDLKLPVTKQTR